VDARPKAGHDGVVVMAGLVPAIHVYLRRREKTECPAQARA